jgi:hypothetical protein
MMCVAAVLCSPWLHYYDLTILAFPLVWLINEALRRGWLPWEKFTVFAGYALPAAITLAMVRLPIAPLVVAALFVAVWRAAQACRVAGNGFANRPLHSTGETARGQSACIPEQSTGVPPSEES